MDGVPADLVFGLDIGTRSIVGTVGYKNKEDQFIVVAQTAISHETRAMLDGQIHDIEKVAETITKVKVRLEEMTGRSYQEVCIAAAGRVLKTIEEEAEIAFADETVVTGEHVYSLDMLAVEKAHARLREQEGDETRFYCVGYSVKQYYQNDYPISNLEGHKSNNIKTELIATFLPDEVVDGLYAAVERAGLLVNNLTLEPIAAINAAIPERFRLLNIALVDVGAGTSDISITRDGSIIAYGMIPAAGDKFTECIARHYLVDFQEADRMKCVSTVQEEVEFHDIMGLPMTIASTEVADVVKETVQTVTKSVADKIIELNGDKTVSAVFVVGGGGKIRGFIESLAEYLDLPKERVALRGTEVLGGVTFLQEDIQVDSLLVTPIGICLNYYQQRNNFIFVYINDERIRLYDNNRLTVLDAALQVGLPNETLFPQKGDAVRYTVNGEQRMLRGEPGEAAVIRLNGVEAGI
ncbi:MAG: pilus assembly protein PilM, partial [Lachnospiraceae bacterium]|nr:pilus assembly protein PilM [Lachnospiraceae bacterium]